MCQDEDSTISKTPIESAATLNIVEYASAAAATFKHEYDEDEFVKDQSNSQNG